MKNNPHTSSSEIITRCKYRLVNHDNFVLKGTTARISNWQHVPHFEDHRPNYSGPKIFHGTGTHSLASRLHTCCCYSSAMHPR